MAVKQDYKPNLGRATNGPHDDPGKSAEDRQKETAGPESDYAAASAPVSAYSTPLKAEGGFYEQDSTAELKGGVRRRRGVVGFIISAFVVGGLFGAGSVLQGPFQLIHMAQLLQRFHFASNEVAGNRRMSKVLRRLTNADNPERARLGGIRNKLVDRYTSRMRAAGFDPIYDRRGNLAGYLLDEKVSRRELTNKDYKVSQLEAAEAGELHLERTSKAKLTAGAEILDVRGKLFTGGVVSFVLQKAGYYRTTSALHARGALKRFGVPWHPFGYVSNRVNEKIFGFWERLRQKNDQDINGDTQKPPPSPVDGEPAPKAPEGGGRTKQVIDEINGKIGKSVAVIGLICLAKGLADNADLLQYLNVVVPLMRLGVLVTSRGNQVMTGKDLNISELGEAASHLYDKGTADKKPGDKGYRAPSSWLNARSVQAERGEPQTGPDAPDTIKGNGQKNFLSKLFSSLGTDEKLLSGACSLLATKGAQAALTVLDPGGAVVGAFQSLALQKFGVIEFLAGLLAGEAVNTRTAGALFGNQANFGVRHAASQQAISMGGRSLTKQEVAQLRQADTLERRQLAREKGFGYRLASLDNPDSLASAALAAWPSPRQALQKAFNLPGLLQNGFANLIKPFTLPVYAAADNSYDYGFPKYGFSLAELDDPALDNPLENADIVERHLGFGPNQQGENWNEKYGKPCFGVTLTPDGFKLNQEVKRYEDVEQNPVCRDGSDDLKRFRMYVLDSMSTQSAACYSGDDQSCSYFFGDAANAGAVGAAGGGAVNPASGDARSLAQQILGNKNILLSGRLVREDIQAAANGQPGTAGVPTSAAILRLIATVGQNHSVEISSIQGGGSGHSSGSRHYSGVGVDFSAVDGKALTGRDAGSLIIIEAAFKVLPSGSRFGEVNCGATPPLPPGFSSFEDSCDHLHVDVPRGTP